MFTSTKTTALHPYLGIPHGLGLSASSLLTGLTIGFIEPHMVSIFCIPFISLCFSPSMGEGHSLGLLQTFMYNSSLYFSLYSFI